MKMTRILAAAGITVGMLIAFTDPASAHLITIRHEEDLGQIVDHSRAIASDFECDGNVVVTQFVYTTIGGDILTEVVDGDGCDNGGASKNVYPQRIQRARVCERGLGPTAGCTHWIYVT